MMIVPKFTFENRAFQLLTAAERMEVLSSATQEIAQGPLTEMPALPRMFPHLTCVMAKEGVHPMMIVCELWEDVLTLQSTTSFAEADSVNWFAMKDWNSV